MSTVEVGARSRFVDHARGVFTDNFTSDTPNSWMSVDLGEGRQLAPDCYSLRHGYASHHFRLMNWRLEASNDAETWTTMRTHTNDAPLPNQNSTASWSVQSAAGYFRYFRIYNHGQCSRDADYAMSAGIELYGLLSKRTIN